MTKFLSVLTVLLLLSCFNSKENDNRILIQTVGIKDFKTKDLVKTIEPLASDTLQIELHPVSDANGFSAQRQLEKEERNEGVKDAYIYIVDSSEKKVLFKGHSHLLDYMSKRGYELSKKQAKVYYIAYTFHKK
ncbi:hypothetical protein [Wenyingzhuangia sp. IMCC45574]